jgi:Protein of unknown function (DUF4012)
MTAGPGREAPATSDTHRRPRWAILGLSTAAVAAVAALGTLAYQGAHARAEMAAARDLVTAARAAAVAGDVGRAAAHLDRLQEHTGAARDATDGALWGAAGMLPWAGDDMRAVRAVSSQLDLLATDALPGLLPATAALRPEALVQRGGTVDVAAIARAAPELDTADRTVRRAATALSAVPGDGLLPQVRAAVDGASRAASDLADLTGTAAQTARILPPLLGIDSPRRYLVSLQNLAESRGTGGITGAYAVLEADAGRVRVARMGSSSDLTGIRVRPDLGEEFWSLYGHQALLFANANLSPHFPYAGRAMLAGFQAAFGERLDGVIGTDPVAMGHLLAATGPVTAADGSVVTAENAARLTMSEVYERFPGAADDLRRDAYLQQVGAAILTAALRGDSDPVAMVQALRRVVAEDRLRIYTTDTDLQAEIGRTPLAGILPAGGPFLGVSHVQMLGNKIDYYLERRVTYRFAACSGEGTPPGRVEVVLANTAPGSRLPDYVSGGPGPAQGHSRLRLSLHGSPGALWRDVRVDGAAAAGSVASERGRPVLVLTVDIPPGARRVITAEVLEPVAGEPRVWVQPAVSPARTSVLPTGCGTAARGRS